MHRKWIEYIRIFWDTFMRNVLYRNAVLTAALGMSVIVATATTLKNAWIMSLLFAFTSIPTCLVSSAFFCRVPRYLRAAAVPITAAIFYSIGAIAIRSYFGAWSTLFRFYLPLVAVNSLMLSRAVRYAPQQTPFEAISDIITCTWGYAAVACAVGGVRELLQNGTLGGLRIHMAGVPFFGFIVLGFAAAIVRAVRLRHEQRQAHKGGGRK